MARKGVNKVILVGNLGQDPETKMFSNGGQITNCSIATSESWKDKQTGENKEATEWHRVSFSNKLSEIASQYLKKGSKVYVEGKLKTRKWQDSNGVDNYTTEIQAYDMQMLDSRNSSQFETVQSSNPVPVQSSNHVQQSADQKNAMDNIDDDIPF